MPNIRPISELRNYASLLESVAPGDPVFLTRNGHGAYAIISISDQEDYEKTKAALQFMCEMNRGIQAGERDGWLNADQLRAHFREKQNEI